MFPEFLVPLWVDLLRLHGHINDTQWLRMRATRRAEEPRSQSGIKQAAAALTRRAVTSLRRHLEVVADVPRPRSTKTAPSQPK
jgi:hypothetical protein